MLMVPALPALEAKICLKFTEILANAALKPNIRDVHDEASIAHDSFVVPRGWELNNRRMFMLSDSTALHT